MITKAGSPGGGQCSAHRLAEVCDSPKRGELGCVIFGSRGLRSRYPLTNERKMNSELVEAILLRICIHNEPYS